jgi:hypothetical protein
MSISCNGLDERLEVDSQKVGRSVDYLSGSTSTNTISEEVTPRLKHPHMLVSVALDEDQPLPNTEACRRWLCSFPSLAKYVKVEGIFASYSTVLLLSIPVAIWNMLPDNPACQPITYVTSRNLISGRFEEASGFEPYGVKGSTPTLGGMSSLGEGATDHRSLMDFQDFNPELTFPMEELAESSPTHKLQNHSVYLEQRHEHPGAGTPGRSTNFLKAASTDVLYIESSKLPMQGNQHHLSKIPTLPASVTIRCPRGCEAPGPSKYSTSFDGQQPKTTPGRSSCRSISTVNSIEINKQCLFNAPSERSDLGSNDRSGLARSDLLPRFRCAQPTSIIRRDFYETSTASTLSKVKGFLCLKLYHSIVLMLPFRHPHSPVKNIRVSLGRVSELC